MPQQDATTTVREVKKAHSIPLDEVLATLSVDPSVGLADEEARIRLEHFGPNSIPKIRGSFWKVYLAPILNWLINIYLMSSFALVAIALLFPSFTDVLLEAVIWLSVVAVNCIVAIFQQYRAQKKLEALEKLAAGETRVLRHGSEMKMDPARVVPGDVVKLEQGDKIPADARIVSCSNLTTNEASLTGESVPSTKDYEAVIPPTAPITDMRNMIFLGTYVSTGKVLAVVTKTGAATEIGKIQRELEVLNTGDIPLRKKVNLLAKYLGITALLLLAVSIVWQIIVFPMLTHNPIIITPEILAANLADAITRAMTIMPINIPLLTTIVLLTGVLAMARHGVIIRDLSAVESLGRVSVICSDKTGTLTRNQMTVKLCWDTQNLYSVTGDGYEPSGHIYRLKDSSAAEPSSAQREDKPTDVKPLKGLYKLVVCGAIDNDSEIVKKEIPGQCSTWSAIGDPTDAALLGLFRKTGLDESEVRKRYKVVKEFPLESELKRVSKICRDGQKFIAFVKGASEVILPRCTTINDGDRPSKLTPDRASKIQAYVNSFAAMGYRVISLAYHDMASFPQTDDARDQTEKNLVYLGFACIVDPPRDGTKEAVKSCHSAGINVVMITGDAAATAKTIARDLGILSPNSLVVEGVSIEGLSDGDFAKANVFARVNPQHKQVIVERYQNQGKVVAMTGDGVNDALALAMCDAGIAMGITGTDVAKEASDLVVTDDSFASIVKGVHQGRGLFNKIRMLVYFYLAINLFESIMYFGGLFLLPAAMDVLTDWQSLYLVVTTHSFPGLALVCDRISRTAMDEKPRDSEAIITHPLAKLMMLNILLMAIGAGLAYALTLTGWLGIEGVYAGNAGGIYPPTPQLKASVMMITVILLVESTLVLIIRRVNMSLSRSLREPGTIIFVPFLAIIYIAHLLLMYVPVSQQVLSSVGLDFYFLPLTLYDWILCILLALPAILGMETYKWHLRRNGRTV